MTIKIKHTEIAKLRELVKFDAYPFLDFPLDANTFVEIKLTRIIPNEDGSSTAYASYSTSPVFKEEELGPMPQELKEKLISWLYSIEPNKEFEEKMRALGIEIEFPVASKRSYWSR